MFLRKIRNWKEDSKAGIKTHNLIVIKWQEEGNYPYLFLMYKISLVWYPQPILSGSWDLSLSPICLANYWSIYVAITFMTPSFTMSCILHSEELLQEVTEKMWMSVNSQAGLGKLEAPQYPCRWNTCSPCLPWSQKNPQGYSFEIEMQCWHYLKSIT